MFKYYSFFVVLFNLPLCAVAVSEYADKSKKRTDLKFNLNESGSQYVKLVFLNQTWVRFNESNPGTTVAGNARDHTFDFGLRRTRLQFFGQLTDRVFFYTQFGMNNFNKTSAFPSYNVSGTPSNRKIGAFFHDALGEYEIYRNGSSFMRFGGGLTIVSGLSRFTQPGVGSILSMDVPVFAQATVDQNDQFGRKLAIYARGQAGKINYRLALADPFLIETNGNIPPALSQNAQFSSHGLSKQLDAMVIWNILETEDNTTPGYMTGTYLGKRSVWNLEAGLIYQKNALRRLSLPDTLSEPLKLWSIASYLDMPVDREKGTAVSAYLGYFKTDYGKGYLRYNGIMNPATGSDLPVSGTSGSHGNAFPMFGTGQVVYLQGGYKFRDNLFGEQGTLQPYFTLQYADYDRLNSGMTVWNTGINWLIKGHNAKLSLDYQSRPVFENSAQDANQLNKAGRKGAVVLQYQISI